LIIPLKVSIPIFLVFLNISEKCKSLKTTKVNPQKATQKERPSEKSSNNFSEGLFNICLNQIPLCKYLLL